MRSFRGRAGSIVGPRLLLGAALTLSSPAVAQRSSENAVRSAEDAFGSSVGNETVGLYSPVDVRGFSPFDAGNVRLEGLYYDAVAGFNGRLIQGSTVRVGISSQGYPFPAPTGIADYRLRLPGQHRSLSVVGAVDSFGDFTTQVDGQLPILGDAVALGGGVHWSSDKWSFGGGGVHSSAAAILRVRPAEGLEIVPFWSAWHHHGMDPMPIIVTSGTFLPGKIRRGHFITQPWEKYKGFDQNSGTIARWNHVGTSLSAGIFRSTSTNHGTFTDLFAGTSADDVSGHHILSASPGQEFSSTSGELRASQSIADGPRQHTFILAARARDRRRRYGGGDAVDLGAVPIDAVAAAPEPGFHFGTQTRDEVRQQSIGVGYRGIWRGVGELTLGVQHVHYRKDINRPGLADPPTIASPWLFNAAATVTMSPKLAIYGSYTRGLEESPVAPSFAINRDEAPPAIMTSQLDGGLRWAVAPHLKLVAGLFDVEKPYFSIDDQRRYRQLGQVRHRGAEISVAGQLGPRLSLVAGAVLQIARVSGERVGSGAIGPRPVGSVPRNLLVNADYQLPGIEGLSADVTVSNLGRQPGNSANSVYVPSSTTLGLGLRFATKLAGHPVSFRLQAANLSNNYSWMVLGSNTYFYTDQRQLTFRITSDL